MRSLPCLAIVSCLAGVAWASPATAQSQSLCNVQAMGLLVSHFQTGQIYLPAFSPEMQQLIMTQTGGTRQYPTLMQLGAVQNIQVIGAQQLPYGAVCGYSVQFLKGALLLQVASGYNNIIYGLQFFPVPQQQPGPSAPGPDPAPPPGPTPSGSGPTTKGPVPTSTDEACKAYPNLC